jgi:ADP-ribose pyrophosphatase YjhB (NUDIX family)
VSARGTGPAFPCARCGAPIRRRRRTIGGHGLLTLSCPRCRYMMYDYPRPCAGMLVLRGDSVLVLRRGHMPRRGMLDVPGGFIEAGEGIEAAAKRELHEETGLTARRARWFGFFWDRYPLRGFGYFPTMNFYYLTCSATGTPVAGDDAAACEWVPVAKLGGRGHRFAWAHMHEVARMLQREARRG